MALNYEVVQTAIGVRLLTICLPTPNSTVLNRVHIIAKATDAQAVNHLEVWLDGTTKVGPFLGNSLDAYISMSAGGLTDSPFRQ